MKGFGDCMDCGARGVECVWSMEPPFWRRCVACHEDWVAFLEASWAP